LRVAITAALPEVSIEVVYSADPPLRDATFRVVVPIVEGYVTLTAPPNSGVTPATLHLAERLKISFIPMIPLEDDQLYQLVPDRNRGGCRAFYRMPLPVLQSDAGTSVRSLGAVPVWRP
jgi:hypothetical protein